MSRTKLEKRQKLSSDDEDGIGQQDDDLELLMDEDEREKFNQMSEKEREIEIFKRLEQREIMKTREQIKRKLEMAAGRTDPTRKTKKRQRFLDKDEDAKGNNSSGHDEALDESDATSSDSDSDHKGKAPYSTDSSDDQKGNLRKNQTSTSHKKKMVLKTEMDDNEDSFDTEYHKPSELADKQNKKKAMSDLLNKRKDKKQAEERRKKEAQKAALDLDEIFGNGDKEDGKSMSSSSSSTTSSRSSSPSLPKSPSPSSIPQPIQTKQELSKCQLIRRRLARIVHASFFNKTVIGCFVRVQIGQNEGKPIYRVAQIVDVVETAKVYEVEPNTEIRTNKGLKLKVCTNDTPRVIRLAFVSNSEITDSEYAFWLNRMHETNSLLPTVDFVTRKQKEIQDAFNYKYTDSDINLMVKEKQRFKRQPTNFAFQKAKLLREKEDAEQNGDSERMCDLQQQINDLEEKAKKIEYQRTKNLSAITDINKRNRDLMKQAFLSTEGLHSNAQNVLELAMKDDDPFTRKSARMRVVSGMTKGETVSGRGDTASASLSALGSVGSSSSLMALGSTDKSYQFPNINNGDLFSAHGIDINIDLNKVLSATTPSAFRSASINAPISNNSGAHALQKSTSSRTLTLEEYKRKYATRLT